jgi:hypothetical protein
MRHRYLNSGCAHANAGWPMATRAADTPPGRASLSRAAAQPGESKANGWCPRIESRRISGDVLKRRCGFVGGTESMQFGWGGAGQPRLQHGARCSGGGWHASEPAVPPRAHGELTARHAERW